MSVEPATTMSCNVEAPLSRLLYGGRAKRASSLFKVEIREIQWPRNMDVL